MDKTEFNSIEKLYHFTSIRNLRKILQNKTLLFGKLKNMNDINERQKDILYSQELFENFPNRSYNNIQKELRNIRQISLTEDGKFKGFDIPAMWGHYAVNGNGACIVFDKEKIINRCIQKKYLYGRVRYKNEASTIIYELDKYESEIEYLKANSKSLFFTKTKDWSYEQEFRIMKFNEISLERTAMDISDCIIAILVYHNTKKSTFDTSKYKSLTKYATDIPILVYSHTFLWNICLTEGESNWIE